MNRAIFLDRDGIINIDKSYVYKIDDVEWMPGIFDLIRFANRHHFLVIVLTNQSGVERNYYTIADVEKLHQQMEAKLNELGLIINDWFYCPSLNSEDRKPNPGMMIKAQKKHNIDLTKSYMIGDKESDVLNMIGPKYLLLKGNYQIENKNVLVFDELNSILKYISCEEKISLEH